MKRPEFIARQGGSPSGFLGRFIAAVMERETEETNQQVITLLDIQQGDRVLDVGTGSGISLGKLAALTGGGLAVGVDHSPVMCRRAVHTNRALIADGRASVECAPSNQLPFDSGTFDAVMSVHTLYFWDPAESHLCEIARVLRPGGQLVLAFRVDDDPATANFPTSVYKFRSAAEVASLVTRCGFENVRFEKSADTIAFLSATRLHNLEADVSPSL